MATIEQLSVALQNAHKAGDVEAAKKLAGAIRQMQGQPAPQAQPQPQPVAQPQLPAQQEPTWGESAIDLAKQFPSGVARAGAMAAGFPGDMSNLIGQGVGAARDYLFGDVSPERRAQINAARERDRILPTTNEIMSTAHNLTGVSLPEPKTTTGEYGRTVGEFAGAALGPGGLIQKGARVLFSGLGSEAAGQLTEGSDFEPYARVLGALPGGFISGSRSPVKVAAKGAPTAQAVKQQTKQLYRQLRSAGIQYDPAAFNASAAQIKSEMMREGFRPSVAGDAFAYIDDIARQSSLDFDDLNGFIRTAGEAQRAAGRTGNLTQAKAFELIHDKLGRFEQLGPLVGGSQLPRAQANSLIKQARQTALKNIKQRELDNILANSDTYQSGVEAGIRNGISNLLRSKKGRGLFRGAERQALLEVAQGRKALRTLSRFGFDLTSMSGNATFLPTVGAIGAGALFDPLAGGTLAAVGTGAKALSPVLTKRAFDQAGAAIRSGSLNNVPRLPPRLTPIGSAAGVGLLGANAQLNLPPKPR